MFLRIDPGQSTPLYAQIVEQVRSLVLSGALRAGDRVPSVRELAVSQRVNRNTAAKAYGVLEAAGVLETRRGQGTFVAAIPAPEARAEHQRRIRDFVERICAEAAGLGLSPTDLARELSREPLTELSSPSASPGASR